MQKGRRIRLPHRSQRPFQFSEPRPGGRASEIDLFFKHGKAQEGFDYIIQFENSSTFLSLVKRESDPRIAVRFAAFYCHLLDSLVPLVVAGPAVQTKKKADQHPLFFTYF